MDEEKKSELPFKELGGWLKKRRQKLQETLADVSGAIEIDSSKLQIIEQGKERPEEDILLLLISYLSVSEDEAMKLWDMAGYDPSFLPGDWRPNTGSGEKRTPVFVLPGDVKIAYTDMVHVVSNDFGLVVNFMQGAGPTGQPMMVSRVGMSHEHAKSLINILQKVMQAPEPKTLPSPKAVESPKTVRRTKKTDNGNPGDVKS